MTANRISAGGLLVLLVRKRWLWLGCAALLLGLVCFSVGQDLGRFSIWVKTLVASGLVLTLLVLVVAWLSQADNQKQRRLLVAFVLVTGLLFRFCVSLSERYLSDDAYRYLWDGKVLSHGINPYRFAPDDPQLSNLRGDELDERINHPSYHTVYPPLAQVYFALGYLLSPGSLSGLQGLLLLSEVVFWLICLLVLTRRNLPSSWIVLAVWSPLLIFESYLPAHLDTLVLPWFAFLIYALDRQWLLRASCALACCCLIKPWALLFVPACVWQVGIRNSFRAASVFMAVVVLAYLPFVSAGWQLFDSTWKMAAFWSYNGSLARLLLAMLPNPVARGLLAGLLLVLVLGAAHFGRDLPQRLLLSLTAFVVVSPTLFPWYLIWLFPVLVIRPDPALLALSGLVLLAELVNIDYRSHDLWALPVWISLIEYIPFYLLLLFGFLRKWGMFARSEPSSANLAANT